MLNIHLIFSFYLEWLMINMILKKTYTLFL